MDPPPTAHPWKMVACLKNWILKTPCGPRLGRHNQRRRDQLVWGRLSGVQRRPISMTATLYPFSASRRAETLPPKPEPMTMKSKSNCWLGCAIQIPTCQQPSHYAQQEAVSKKCAGMAREIGESGGGVATTVRRMLFASRHQPWNTLSPRLEEPWRRKR